LSSGRDSPTPAGQSCRGMRPIITPTLGHRLALSPSLFCSSSPTNNHVVSNVWPRARATQRARLHPRRPSQCCPAGPGLAIPLSWEGLAFCGVIRLRAQHTAFTLLLGAEAAGGKFLRILAQVKSILPTASTGLEPPASLARVCVFVLSLTLSQ
jgi:hypothetical protein